MDYASKAVGFAMLGLARALGVQEHKMGDFIFKLRIFGHSLGGHLAGMIGQFFKRYEVEKNYMISLILAMDPAGYMFHPEKGSYHCVTWRDANRVIVLHASIQGPMALGNSLMLGHEDIYLNCGVIFHELHFMSHPYARKVISHLRVLNAVLRLAKGFVLTGFRYRQLDKPIILTEMTPEEVKESELKPFHLDLLQELNVLAQPADPSRDPIYASITIDKDMYRRCCQNIKLKRLNPYGHPLNIHIWI